MCCVTYENEVITTMTWKVGNFVLYSGDDYYDNDNDKGSMKQRTAMLWYARRLGQRETMYEYIQYRVEMSLTMVMTIIGAVQNSTVHYSLVQVQYSKAND